MDKKPMNWKETDTSFVTGTSLSDNERRRSPRQSVAGVNVKKQGD